MAFYSTLLGPPELYPKPSSSFSSSSTTAAASTVDADGDALMATAPRLGFTENNSLTFVATGNPCLDFFFHVVPDTPYDSLIKRLTKAWAYDPLTTVKLVCNLRGIRGTGKCDKERFYVAALWLHRYHPKTLALNAGVLVEFGYYKDLLEILYRLLEGENVREVARNAWKLRKKKKGKGLARKAYFLNKRRMARRAGRILSGGGRGGRGRGRGRRGRGRRGGSVPQPISSSKPKLPREVRIAQNKAKNAMQKEQSRAARKEKQLNNAKRAYERYTRDPDYRFLHDCIAEVFANALKNDMQYLNSGERYKISLASKWCPSIDSSYDKVTLICENIARRVFPRESDPEYVGIEEAHYVYRVRDRLRKQVLVPLHKALQLPEVYMSANRWRSLPYNRVPSLAMKNCKEHFFRHDNKRFHRYLENVQKGDATIAAGALLPHEIIASLQDGDNGKVAELQWVRMVQDMLKIGKFNNCVAVCDVSGSMSGTPMEVCVSLGLMISELSEEPWKGKVITFSEYPQMHFIRGDSLLEKTQFVRKMDWGGNTDFQKVFDRILQVAVDAGLSEDQMIRKVFVFSDMEFDQASGHYAYGYGSYYDYSDGDSYTDMDSDIDDDDEDSENELEEKQREMERRRIEREEGKFRNPGWETDYEVIQRKFSAKGFNKVPEIIFWNLRHSKATPVSSNQSGVALVSGYSKNMAKLFLDNAGIVSPVAVMEQAISGELYQRLFIHD